MDDPTPPQADDQYSRAKTVGIWFLGGAPMWILGWLVYPAISKGMAVADAGLMRLLLMTTGLAWQCVLAMIILYCEEGNIRWATICRRFWLRHPISPKTGRVDKRLWWWLISLGVLVVAVDFVIAGPINDLWVTAMPFLAEPEGYHASALGWLLLLCTDPRKLDRSDSSRRICPKGETEWQSDGNSHPSSRPKWCWKSSPGSRTRPRSAASIG